MAHLKVPVAPADHAQGPEDAPVTLVEYGDYQCPHCGHAYPIIQKVQKHYGDKLRFVFRNFPLAEIHPYAEAAAEAAEFAASQGKFWEMHDAIFEGQNHLSPSFLVNLGGKLGLAEAKVKEALEGHEFLPRIKSDFMSGVRSGVNGTPTFYINGEQHESSFEFEDLVEAIDDALGKLKKRVS